MLLKTALKGGHFTPSLWKLNTMVLFVLWFHLKTSFFVSDPSSVNLEKVSNIIIDQSLKDQVFSKEAGRICYTIVQVCFHQAFSLIALVLAHLSTSFMHNLVLAQAEAKQTNGNVFRRSLLNRLQQEFKNREEMRRRSLHEWVCFVTFICNIFDYLKVSRPCRCVMTLFVHSLQKCILCCDGCSFMW